MMVGGDMIQQDSYVDPWRGMARMDLGPTGLCEVNTMPSRTEFTF